MSTTTTNWKALCAEQLPELRGMFERILCVARSSGGPTVGNIQLADRLIDAVVSWSATTLAQPEPEGPSDDELDYWWAEIDGGPDCCAWRPYARTVLARWGRPAIKPVPVAERPWKREGWCDTDGICWWWHAATDDTNPGWIPATYADIELVGVEFFDSSLPHWALPVPTPNES